MPYKKKEPVPCYICRGPKKPMAKYCISCSNKVTTLTNKSTPVDRKKIIEELRSRAQGDS